MKKFLAMLLTLCMVLAFAGCAQKAPEATEAPDQEATTEAPAGETPAATEEDVKSEGVMTYAEYVAAELESQVTVETYVQAKQSWWEDKATVYSQDKDGAYFLYNMACSQEDYDKLVPGTKIKVTGYKSEWSGEIEIIDATFEIEEGSFIAIPFDATELLGKDELIDHQNQLVSFKGLTVEKVAYKNDQPGDDIYVTFGYNGASYDFCVESYLTGPDTEVYSTVGALKEGDVVDVEGFLYWYEGVNTHITAITAAKSLPSSSVFPSNLERKSVAPENAIWLMYFLISSAVMPIPLSIICNVFLS